MGLNSRRQSKGFVLIFALWVLGLLTFFAVSIALGVRQKTLMAEKLEDNNRMYYLLEAALKQSKAYVRKEMEQQEYVYSAQLKARLHRNFAFFGNIPFGTDIACVRNKQEEKTGGVDAFGVIDEERKININTVSVLVLKRLVEYVLGIDQEEALRLSEAIIDWRQRGESQTSGFYSDAYYRQLQRPYFKKDAAYELLEELLLVKGVTRAKYEKLLPYLTVFGEGKININTAPKEVLYALGLDPVLVQKVLKVRQGHDGLEATLDDVVFQKTFDVASTIQAYVELDPSEVRILDALNLQGALTTNSYYFYLLIEARLGKSGWMKTAQAILSPRENKVLYWREK